MGYEFVMNVRSYLHLFRRYLAVTTMGPQVNIEMMRINRELSNSIKSKWFHSIQPTNSVIFLNKTSSFCICPKHAL